MVDLPANNNNNKDSKYHTNFPLPVGTILAERFRILKVLGKGSFGVVYQCSEERT